MGVRLARLGTSSVRYELAVFGAGEAGEAGAAAEGHFTHVYVARATGRPVPVPDALRVALAALRPVPEALRAGPGASRPPPEPPPPAPEVPR